MLHADLVGDDHSYPQNQSVWTSSRWRCRLCNQKEGSTPATTGNKLSLVEVPAVFRYLSFELACLNVQTKLETKDFS